MRGLFPLYASVTLNALALPRGSLAGAAGDIGYTATLQRRHLALCHSEESLGKRITSQA
jgi:hypothetical protein